jgi:uncharacterized RDD family membrane protein YckC
VAHAAVPSLLPPWACEVPTGGTIAIAVILGIVGFIGVLAYWAKLEGGSGQTVGKRALSIRTVDTASGQEIGGGRAIGRYFARIVSGLVCGLGYFWMLWGPAEADLARQARQQRRGQGVIRRPGPAARRRTRRERRHRVV